MRKVETYGRIENGKLFISYRNKFLDCISQMPDCRVEVVVKKLYKQRSNDQNAYYWGYIIQQFIEGFHDMNQEWITKEQAHEFLKGEFCFDEFVNEDTGEIKRIAKETKTLSTVEFMEYCDNYGRFITEWFGREILAPNQQGKLELKFEKND